MGLPLVSAIRIASQFSIGSTRVFSCSNPPMLRIELNDTSHGDLIVTYIVLCDPSDHNGEQLNIQVYIYTKEIV